MPKDDKNVQTDATSEDTGATSTGETATSEGETETQEQPFTEAQQVKLQEMITQAKTDAEQAGFIKGGRDMQGKKDREVAEAQRRAKFAEGSLAGYDTGLGQLDPEQAELIRLRAQDAAHRRSATEETQRQQMDTFDKSFTSNMTQFITSAGLDPNDKRIDWAEDVSGDYLAKQQRILASVTKAQKEEAKAMEERLEQKLKDADAKIRKDLEIDSVDTSASAGAGGPDDEFLVKFSEGKVDMTKENIARADKIMKK